MRCVMHIESSPLPLAGDGEPHAVAARKATATWADHVMLALFIVVMMTTTTATVAVAAATAVATATAAATTATAAATTLVMLMMMPKLAPTMILRMIRDVVIMRAVVVMMKDED